MVKLSTQELILLGQEKNLASENSYGKANTSKYIDKEKALAIAMDAAGVGDWYVFENADKIFPTLFNQW